MNNKGFIATSLIYVFFLAFISIITALVGDYVSNETIETRMNEQVEDDLNTSTHKVDIYSHQDDVKDSSHLYNLIQNSDFSEVDGSEINFWVNNGASTSKTTNTMFLYSGSLTPRFLVNQYISQRTGGTYNYNHRYYYQIEYNDSHGSGTFSFASGGTNAIGVGRKYTDTGAYGIVRKYAIRNGLSSSSDNIVLSGNNLEVKDVMLIDLDNSFKKSGFNNIPNEEWFGSEGLEYFKDNLYFYRKKNIKDGSNVTFYFKKPGKCSVPYTCNTNIPANSTSCENFTDSRGNQYTKFTFKKVTNDLVCHFGEN